MYGVRLFRRVQFPVVFLLWNQIVIIISIVVIPLNSLIGEMQELESVNLGTNLWRKNVQKYKRNHLRIEQKTASETTLKANSHYTGRGRRPGDNGFLYYSYVLYTLHRDRDTDRERVFPIVPIPVPVP